MSDLLSDVARHIRREGLLQEGEPVRVAVSGGIDSMVLLHVLRERGHPCSVVHVDHALRGSESDADQDFVRATCAAAGIPFTAKRVDVSGFARERGVSIQMAARELRYAWFRDLRSATSAPIALGHHADDAVETMLLGLMRGTGVHGWAGIRPANDGFVRPLLCVGREEIARYARSNDVHYREDSSNADPGYLRNRLRLEVLPMLEAARPGALRAMARSLGALRELERLASARIAEEGADLSPDEGGVIRIPFERLMASAAPHLLLLHLLRDRGFHPDTVERIFESVIDRSTGSVFTSADFHANVDRDSLIIAPASVKSLIHVIGKNDAPPKEGPFWWTQDAAAGMREDRNAEAAWLDADQLTFPLELRPWRHGDRIRPIGLGGSKLVSDLLIDAKVPMAEKQLVHVLVSNGIVVWVSGHRVAEGFQARPGTRSVFLIERVLRKGLDESLPPQEDVPYAT